MLPISRCKVALFARRENASYEVTPILSFFVDVVYMVENVVKAILASIVAAAGNQALGKQLKLTKE